jgi:CDP-diacylglycerol--glycerol-3-phosphate 3-phosphatidyltransferase
MVEGAVSPAARAPGSARPAVILNVPNQLTIARLILSVICFVFLAYDFFGTALVLFVIAAGTDWIDGYWARRYGQITQLGRILDPFADKIIICGSFIFLAAVPPTMQGESASEVSAWMAVVVVGREILVTALRSFFEEHGTDFSANWPGKLKMVFQCAAVAASLARLWYYRYGTLKTPQWPTDSQPPDWTTWSLRLLVWAAIAMTVYSGWVYVRTAVGLWKKMQSDAARE